MIIVITLSGLVGVGAILLTIASGIILLIIIVFASKKGKIMMYMASHHLFMIRLDLWYYLLHNEW